MNFEDKLERLQQIITLLENDKLSLDKALDCYKEGVELSVDCRKMLENARLTVKNINAGEETEND